MTTHAVVFRRRALALALWGAALASPALIPHARNLHRMILAATVAVTVSAGVVGRRFDDDEIFRVFHDAGYRQARIDLDR